MSGRPAHGDFVADDEFFEQTRHRGIDFRYIIAAIRRNLVLIAAIIAACVAAAVIFTLLDTPRYTATARIQINQTTDRVLKSQDDTDTQAYDTDPDRFLKTQIDVLQSRSVALRVAKRLKLFGNAGFYHAMEATPPGPEVREDHVRDQLIELLRNNLTVDLPRDSRITSIAFNSASPQVSAAVANAFAAEFIQSNLQRKFDSSSYARNFISDQLTDAKMRLEESERALNDYARQAGLINVRNTVSSGLSDNQSVSAGSISTASLVQLNQAANEARARRIDAQARWSAVASAPLLSSRDVLASPVIADLQQRKGDAEAKLSDERSRHLDDHPAVIAQRAQIAAIDQQIMAQAQSIRNSVHQDYLATLNAEQQLNGQVDALKNNSLNDQDRAVRYNTLAREADTNRQLYDSLLQQYKNLNAAAGISASNVAIIDDADPPLNPSAPNLFKNLAGALMIGFVVAAFTVFLKDQFDDAIRVPEDIEQKLQLPLLGVIPKALRQEPEDALADPKSPISEAYNSLRGSLLYSTPRGLPPMLLVTSAQPSEGKSTSSYAIASSFARMGQSVLLVDVDLRRPSLHKRIGSDNAVGISTLLTSDADFRSVLSDSGQPNLTLITSGPVPPSPTEIITSARMQQLLDELGEAYDVVILDSPPILGLADAPTLSALVDGVVLVVEAGRTRRGTLKTSLRRLRSMRPNILGALLTKFDANKAGNRYSEYYGYDYYQYSPDEKRT